MALAVGIRDRNWRAVRPILVAELVFQQVSCAVIGVLNLRSRNWAEVRLPVLMAIVFNGVSFLVAVRAIVQGDPLLMPVTVAIATFVVTAPMIYGFVTIRTGE